MSVALVVNPRSGDGATGRRLPELERAVRAFADDVVVFATEGPGDGARQARRAVDAGHRRVVAVGGDGTVHEVVNGLFEGDRPVAPDAVLGVIHAGTGGDFVRSLGVPRDLEGAARIAVTAPGRPCDVLRVDLVGTDGEPRTELCINVLGFGMSGEVVRRANQGSKRWGGRVTFARATLAALRTYRPPRVRVRWSGPDGDGAWEGALTSAFVANGAYCGGGMWIGRGGALDDGAGDLVLIPDLPLGKTIFATPRLYSGTVGNVKEVSTGRVRELHAEALSEGPVLLDLDGEQPGRLPVTVRVLEKRQLVARL